MARLNERIKREISELIRTEVRDPRIGLPTVTAVDVTPDLWVARVYVRPGPVREDGSAEEMLEALAKAAPFIRRELGKSLKVRRIPELRFLADRTLEEALRIEEILRTVATQQTDRGDGDPSSPGAGEDRSSRETQDP